MNLIRNFMLKKKRILTIVSKGRLKKRGEHKTKNMTVIRKIIIPLLIPIKVDDSISKYVKPKKNKHKTINKSNNRSIIIEANELEVLIFSLLLKANALKKSPALSGRMLLNATDAINGPEHLFHLSSGFF